MNKLGSEFLKEFDHFERPVFAGRTKRQLVFGLGIVIGVGLSVGLYFLHFPIVVIYILMAVIVTPTSLYGMKKDIELRERYRFRFTIQERAYMTEHQTTEKPFTKADFKPQKGVTEFEETNKG